MKLLLWISGLLVSAKTDAFRSSNNIRGLGGKKGGTSSKHVGGKKGGSKKALQILEMAIEALGGVTNLMAMEGIVANATGEGRILFEGLIPEDDVTLGTYSRGYFQTYDNLRIDETTYPPLPNETVAIPLPDTVTSNIVVGMVGTMIGDRLTQLAGEQPSHSVGAYKQQQYLFNPHWMLQAVYMDNSKMTKSYTEGTYEVLVLQDEETSDVHIYVDAVTGVIDHLTLMESNPLIMDILITVKFSEWMMASSGGLYFPMVVQEYESLHNSMLMDETRTYVAVQAIDDTVFAGIPEPSLLLDPEGFKFGRQTQHNTAPFFWLGFHYPYDPPRYSGLMFPIVPAMVWWWPSLAGIIAVRDPSDNGLIVLEAPGTAKHMQTFWKLINQDLSTFDWHIKYIVQSHHHVDHAAGARELLALSKQATEKGPTNKQDAKLIIGFNIEDFWDGVFKAPATVIPDSLSKMDYTPEIIAIPVENGSVVLLNDPGVRITAHHTTEDPHADDSVMTVIQIWGNIFVYQADLLNTKGAPKIIAKGPLGLFNAMREKGLIDAACVSPLPLFIIGSHGQPEPIQASISELCALGFDVGCQCPPPP